MKDTRFIAGMILTVFGSLVFLALGIYKGASIELSGINFFLEYWAFFLIGIIFVLSGILIIENRNL